MGSGRGALSRAAAAAAVALLCLTAPAGARAVSYGISDAPGAFASCPTFNTPCSSPGGVGGFWRSPQFAALTSGPRPLARVRLPVTYDAVATWNGSGCALSDAYLHPYTDQGGRGHPAGQSWYDLLYGLQAAYDDGIQPLVVIDGYTQASAAKSYVGSAAQGSPGEPDPTTTSGYWDFYCGIRGILNGIAAHLPVYEWPHQWEAWNEPNGGCTYLNNSCTAAVCAHVNEPPSDGTGTGTCSATARGDSSCAIGSSDSGAAKAGCLWIEARNTIVQYGGHAGDEVAAGTFSFPSTGYLTSYVHLLDNEGYHPGTWSVHDYADPTASGWLQSAQADELQAFDTALGQDTAGIANQLWVTESGVLLTDRDRRYGPHDSIPCPAGSPASAAGTLGACIDGAESAQVTATEGFFDLANVTGGPPVTALYWFQWQGATSAWDSGLLDASGRPRASYCVWAGEAPSTCNGDPHATG
jgi:hypothetical protein